MKVYVLAHWESEVAPRVFSSLEAAKVAGSLPADVMVSHVSSLLSWEWELSDAGCWAFSAPGHDLLIWECELEMEFMMGGK